MSTGNNDGLPAFGPIEGFHEKEPLELPTKTRLKVFMFEINYDALDIF